MTDSNNKAAKTFYQKMIGLGWVKRSYWIRPEAHEAVKAAVEYESNKYIGAICNAKTDKAELISQTKDLPSRKGE